MRFDRSCIEGLAYYEKKASMEEVRKVLSEISHSRFTDDNSNDTFKKIFGFTLDCEKSFMQIILSKYSTQILKILLKARSDNQNLSEGLPEEIIEVVEKTVKNIRYNRVKWFAEIFKIWLTEFLKTLKVLFKIILIRKEYSDVYVFDISNSSLENKKYSLLESINKHVFGRIKRRPKKISKENKALGVPLTFNQNRFIIILYLINWFIKTNLLLINSTLKGEYWYVFFLKDAFLYKALELSKGDYSKASYYFHWVGSIYKPIWVNYLEDQKAYTCLFYTSNSVSPKSKGKDLDTESLHLMTWRNVLVWTNSLKNYITSTGTNIDVVGPIYYEDRVQEYSKTYIGRNIALFPVESHKITYTIGISTYQDWLFEHPNQYEMFANDIVEVLLNKGYYVDFKNKRAISSRRTDETKKVLKNLSKTHGVNIIPESVSPRRVLDDCIASISFPFTSTALYLNTPDNPAIYYDPTGWIEKDDPAACGVPIMSGKDELNMWVDNFIVTLHEA